MPVLQSSRVLDGLVHLRLVGPAIFMKDRIWSRGGEVPAYTSDMGAAVALVERVLPRWSWGISVRHHRHEVHLSLDPEHPLNAGVIPGPTDYLKGEIVHASPPALSLCIALFAVIDGLLRDEAPTFERGVLLLSEMLELPSDEFGRREIECLKIGEKNGI